MLQMQETQGVDIELSSFSPKDRAAERCGILERGGFGRPIPLRIVRIIDGGGDSVSRKQGIVCMLPAIVSANHSDPGCGVENAACIRVRRTQSEVARIVMKECREDASGRHRLGRLSRVSGTKPLCEGDPVAAVVRSRIEPMR